MSTMEATFLNTNDAAAEMGITPDHVRRLCKTSEIRGVKANERAWLVPVSEIERFLEKPRGGRGRPRIGDSQKNVDPDQDSG